MVSAHELTRSIRHASGAPLRWAVSAWRTIHFGSMMMVLALTPSSYTRTARAQLARHAYVDTVPILWGFSLLVALLTVVITRIVVVTASTYGLSRYGLEIVIRVIVLELIPLTAALFVALRCTIPNGAALAEMRRTGRFDRLRASGLDPMRVEVLPRLVAGIYATVTLAAVSGAVASVIAYLAVYGLTTAGLPSYTRTFGHVFDSSVTLVFTLKTLLFALAVSVIPMASGLFDTTGDGSRETAALQGLVRLFTVLLVLEAVGLMGNYY